MARNTLWRLPLQLKNAGEIVEKSLQQHLLNEVNEQWSMLNEQVGFLEPIITHFEEPEPRKVLRKGLFLLGECLGYLLFAGTIYLLFTMHQQRFFTVLIQVGASTPADTAKINLVIIAGYGLVLICGLLFLALALLFNKLRSTTSLLYDIGDDIRLLYEQQLTRKAAIERIDSIFSAPSAAQNTPPPSHRDKVNSVRNPGFEGDD